LTHPEKGAMFKIKMALPDHGFSKCALFGDRNYVNLSCQTRQLQPIARAFTRNMNRVRGMGMLPINLTTVAIINEAARVEALVNKGIPLHDPRITFNHPKFDSTLFDEVNEERKRLADEWVKSHPSAIFESGVEGMNLIIDSNKDMAWEAVQATMAAMLIGLWTAFESLAQDTWIAGVNERPIPLAERTLDPRLQKGDQAKTFSFKLLVSSGFNQQRSMGTILLRERKVDFQTLGNIRDAYKAAFDGEMEPIFEAHNLELFRLETVRNLFVHKGGVIDQKFIKRMGNEPIIKEREGGFLTVNGEYVAHKANVVSACATQLVQAVDKWLTENPSVAQEARPNDADDDS
jgi:hypothetical protein